MTQDAASSASRVSGFYIEKAKNLGHNFPIGINQGNQLVKPFTINELGYEKEKSIGKWKNNNRDKPNTTTVTRVLSLVMSSIGGEKLNNDLDGDSREALKDILMIRNLYMFDVFYAFLCARIEELGNEYISPWKCRACGLETTVKADLLDMDITCTDLIEDLTCSVDLVKGIKFRDGKIKKKVFISPIRWGDMEDKEISESGGDETLMKLFFISRALNGVEDFTDKEGNTLRIVLTEQELASLRKMDIEILHNAINKMNLGPSLLIEGKCPNKECKLPYSENLNWDYDDFFSIYSPSLVGKS